MLPNKNKKVNRAHIFLITISSFFIFASAANAECIYNGENFQVKDNPNQILSPIHRLYNTETGTHLYTKGITDANSVLGKYPEYEFTDVVPAFCAYYTYQEGLTPIYRTYNTRNGTHLYARGDVDLSYVLGKYPEYEFTDGIPAFYASLTPQPGLTPVFRLYNTQTGVHLYTKGDVDRNYILNKYSEYEFTDGIPAFYMHLTYDSGPPLIKYEGPLISVGLWSKSHIDAESDPFRITASKSFNITDCGSTLISSIPEGETARVKYVGSQGMLQTYNSNTPSIFTNTMNRVCLEASDGNNTDMIFDVNTPDNLSKGPYDRYRGKIKIQHSNTDDNYNLYQAVDFPDLDLANSKRRIWVINTLPLEQYMWGYGEMKGGVEEHSKALSVTARSYARWYIEYATKWADSADLTHPENGEGFDILSYSFSQIYSGYDYELKYPLVADSVKKTKGVIMKYGTEYVLGAYSSYTDGNTRAFPGYPYMVSVPDPYGKNSSMTTEQMVAAGNHMWGLSASGSVVLARDYGWSWDKILKYYYTGISIVKEY
ncbi:MAG: peptidase S1 and S6 chymotrypsin/Hap [uncultured bacterium]|nr:MAG: peptidase S1 and S6 chymotrypsin/Hap [uncultured bacterium]